MVVFAPNVEQRTAALGVANSVRLAIAEQKKEIHALEYRDGLLLAARLLDECPPHVGAMRIGHFLLSVRRFGHQRISYVCTRAGIRSLDRRVRELSERQRGVLSVQLRESADVGVKRVTD